MDLLVASLLYRLALVALLKEGYIVRETRVL